MANKILAAENLSDEQLEQVAGGTWAQTTDDKNFFKQLGIDNKVLGNAWKQFGIDFTSRAGENYYKTDGVNNSQTAAYGMVLQQLKYPGYVFDPSDTESTKDFVKANFGITVL